LGKRIVVFAPHPDDETFGCGGTIAKKISEGHEVLIVVMTDGRHAFLHVLGIESDPTPEQLKKIRREELKRAAKHLGVPENNLIFLDFVDGTLLECEHEATEKVIEILSMFGPDEVYFPHKSDGHSDHRAAYRIVNNSLKRIGLNPIKYQYQITHKYARIGPIIESFIDFFTNRKKVDVDISNFLYIKKLAIEEFKSEITAVSVRQHKPVIKSVHKFLKSKEEFYVE